MNTLFLQHPKEHNVSYFKHFKISMNLSYLFCKASLKACIHAFIPYFYTTSSTDALEDLDKFMKSCY